MVIDNERHVFITGFGGQGIVMAGDILGKAATLHDGKQATMTQNYGPEARGGPVPARSSSAPKRSSSPVSKNRRFWSA
jgi:Pyruvate/2-oxoacid:ferredoxin oxidoreductase gamma subunit